MRRFMKNSVRVVFCALALTALVSTAATAQPMLDTAPGASTNVIKPPQVNNGFSGYSSNPPPAAASAPPALPQGGYVPMQAPAAAQPMQIPLDAQGMPMQQAVQQPQVMPQQVAPAQADPAQAAVATPPPAPDPCAAYMASYESYVVCQDRTLKIQRMKEAKEKRNAPPPAPAAAPAAPVIDPAIAAAAAAAAAAMQKQPAQKQPGLPFRR